MLEAIWTYLDKCSLKWKILEKKFEEVIDDVLQCASEVTKEKREFYEEMRKEILVDFTPMQLEGCGEIAEGLNYANFIFSWASDLCKRIWPYVRLYYLRHGVIYWLQPRYYNPLDPEPRMFSIQFSSLRAKCKDRKLGGDRSGILTIRENLTIGYIEQEPRARTRMERFYQKVCEVYVVGKFRTPLQMASYLHKDLLREVVGI
ncbi:MAG: hypothetical protein QW115_04220 [Thermoplasmata archaeon]